MARFWRGNFNFKETTKHPTSMKEVQYGLINMWDNNGVESEVIERLRFIASLALAGTGQRKGGEKMQPFNRFQSRLGK